MIMACYARDSPFYLIASSYVQLEEVTGECRVVPLFRKTPERVGHTATQLHIDMGVLRP